MKYLQIACFISFTVFYVFGLRDVMDDLSKGMAICYKKLNDSDAEILDRYEDDDYLQEGISTVNDFYDCTFKESGYIDNDQINFDILKKALLKSPGIVKENVEIALKKCKNINGISLGDKIVKVLNCLAKYKAIN